MNATLNANVVSDVTAWHAMSQADVLDRLATSLENGLAPAESSARLQKYGPNRLPEGRKRGPFTRFFAQFHNILIYVLLAAGFIKLLLHMWHRQTVDRPMKLPERDKFGMCRDNGRFIIYDPLSRSPTNLCRLRVNALSISQVIRRRNPDVLPER